MAFRRRKVTDAAANGTYTVHFGAQYGVFRGLVVDGNDASADVTVTDADGRNVFAKTGLDANGTIGSDNSFDGVMSTEDDASAPIAYNTVGTAVGGSALPPVSRFPLTAVVANNSGTINLYFYAEV